MLKCDGNLMRFVVDRHTHPGDIIRLAREYVGLTREQLEERSGYSVSTIRNWERREARPTWEGVRDLLMAMGFGMEVRLAS